MKIPYVVLLAVFSTLVVGSGRAEATIGFGYRANETVRVDRCYRGFAWDYAVPFYLVGPNHRYHRNRCIKRLETRKSFK